LVAGATFAATTAEEVPIKGWESVMIRSRKRWAFVDLQALLAAVKASPILAWPRRRSPLSFANWATVRKSKDVDAYVLAWIASHVRHGTRRVPLQ
jgi:hypothetical protein